MAVYHKHPSAFPLNFIIIGAGGTGSRIVPMLAQLIQSLPYMANLRPILFLVDDDIVEEKNLTRQLFAPQDVGQHKAKVITERYSQFYPSLEMHGIVGRVDDRDSLPTFTIGTLIKTGMSPEDSLKIMARRTVVITAVDSMESRRWCIASALHLPSPLSMTFLDPGNEDTFGQVTTFSGIAQCIVTNKSLKDKVDSLPVLCPFNLNTAYIPMPLTHYFLTPDGERTGGCADLDQTLALNALAASRTFDYIQAMMYNVPQPTHTTRFGLGGEASCSKMDVAWLKRLSEGKEQGYTDYQRLAEIFNVPLDTFNSMTMESSQAGDDLFKRVTDGKNPLSDACRLILNAIYFIPCFNILEAEEEMKNYEAAQKAKVAAATLADRAQDVA